MKKRNKTILLAGIVTCLIIATLAGCGKKETVVTQRNNSVVTTPDVLTPPETTSEPDVVDEGFSSLEEYCEAFPEVKKGVEDAVAGRGEVTVEGNSLIVTMTQESFSEEVAELMSDVFKKLESSLSPAVKMLETETGLENLSVKYVITNGKGFSITKTYTAEGLID